MKPWYNKRYFPWAPGISWTLRNGKFVVPSVDYDTWKDVLGDREIVIVVFGGLLESFFSLSFAEALAIIQSGRKISWLGNNDFQYLVRAQGLVRVSDLNFTESDLKKYPLPFFIDAENRAYYSCLNNYLVSKSLFGSQKRINKDCRLKQIFDNSLVPFDAEYIPKLRNLQQMSKEYESWKSAYKFDDREKFILIIPGNGNSLEWADRDIKELVGLTDRFGLKVVVCTDRIGTFYGQRIYLTLNNPIILINLLKKAWMILADQLDYLLMGLMLSKAIIVASNHEKELYKNAEWLGIENCIYTDVGVVSPLDIYGLCEGMI
jgi:hypothetical protein